MRYKHFKNADVDVSELAVGTWAIGGDNYGPVDREASIQAIRTMIDNGVNLVDTATAIPRRSSGRLCLVGTATRCSFPRRSAS